MNMPTDVRLRVWGAGQQELTSVLHNLLRDEDTLRGAVSTAATPPSPEEMGGVADVLVVALGSGGAVGALATVLAVWLRQARSDISVEITSTDGRRVTVDAKRVADVEGLLDRVLDAQPDEPS